MTSRFILLAAIAVGLAACSKTPATGQSVGPTTEPPTSPGQEASNAPKPAAAGSPAASTSPTSQPAPPPPALPDGLKTDAYAYYGLGVEAPETTDLKIDGKSFTGQHSLKLQTVNGNSATYLETQTGTPNGDQSQTVSLTPEGIYVESISPGTLKTPHILTLPNRLTPGSTWKTHMELDLGDRNLVSDSTDRVVGMQKVHLKTGDVEALYVSGSGTGSLGTDKISTTDQWWYAKNKGVVKSIQTIAHGGKTQTVETVLEG